MESPGIPEPQPQAVGDGEPISTAPPVGEVVPVSGLNYLGQATELRIQQQVEIAEVMTGFDMKNKYWVTDQEGRRIYFVHEESNCFNRTMCGNHRGFIMRVQDVNSQEVFKMEREFECCRGCCWLSNPSCHYSLNVTANGQALGVVRQGRYWIGPKFSIQAASGEELYRIEGPTCVCDGPCCLADVPFNVFSPTGSEVVACISRIHSGCAQEMCTRANNFKVQYLLPFDANSKALILAATFLIDMMFFERG